MDTYVWFGDFVEIKIIGNQEGFDGCFLRAGSELSSSPKVGFV